MDYEESDSDVQHTHSIEGSQDDSMQGPNSDSESVDVSQSAASASQSEDVSLDGASAADTPSQSSQNGNGTDHNLYIKATPTLTHNPTLIREIGHEAVWSLSTAKPGNGVEQIRDSSIDTYWQSDGGQPHLINIQFAKRASVNRVAFYLDYNLDESYTPKRISVRVGMTFHDLVEVRVVELNEPVGWVSVPLRAAPDPLDQHAAAVAASTDENNEQEQKGKPIRAHFIQVCVVSMHQNGRDTHIRQVKIFGPRNYAFRRTSRAFPEFTTTEMSLFSTIR